MADAIPNPEPANSAAHLDCERLDCYGVAVEFQALACRLISNRRVSATLRDQRDRASVSIVLCIAEGAGRRTARDQADPETGLARPGDRDIDRGHRDQQRCGKGAVSPQRLALLECFRCFC